MVTFSGTVVSFNEGKDFGFLKAEEDPGEDVFFLRSELSVEIRVFARERVNRRTFESKPLTMPFERDRACLHQHLFAVLSPTASRNRDPSQYKLPQLLSFC